MLFVISGPSGCGKSTLVRHILENLDNVEFSVSYTTRKKRETEKEGKDYFFISQEEFKKLIQEDKLAEWAVVHGNYYGTPKRELEKRSGGGDVLLDIDVQGAAQIKEMVKKAVFVFILPPLFPELKKRLGQRGQEGKESIKRRLEVAKREIRQYYQFDYIIINDRLDTAAEELKAVILNQRCRTDIRKKEIIPILRSFSGED
jgi:guanylate kinase